MCEETSQQDRTRTDALIKDLTNCKINCFFPSMQSDEDLIRNVILIPSTFILCVCVS